MYIIYLSLRDGTRKAFTVDDYKIIDDTSIAYVRKYDNTGFNGSIPLNQVDKLGIYPYPYDQKTGAIYSYGGALL